MASRFNRNLRSGILTIRQCGKSESVQDTVLLTQFFETVEAEALAIRQRQNVIHFTRREVKGGAVTA